LGDVVHLKGLLSITIDTKLFEQFQKDIPDNKNSKIIEYLIRDFVSKKKTEQLAIIAQVNAKKNNQGNQSKGVLS